MHQPHHITVLDVASFKEHVALLAAYLSGKFKYLEYFFLNVVQAKVNRYY
jgi:hypothetical protein